MCVKANEESGLSEQEDDAVGAEAHQEHAQQDQ